MPKSFRVAPISASLILAAMLAGAGCEEAETTGGGATFSGTDASFEASAPAVPDGAAPATTDAGDAAPQDAAPPNSSGCASGSRAGLDLAKYPGVAACAGVWQGSVATATALCASGWHVCTGAEPSVTAVTYDDAIAVTGCFAIDAAQDNFVCTPSCAAAVTKGVDTASNIDMAAIGSACPYKFPAQGGCITGGRIDFSENSGTGCDYAAGLTGAVCCKD